MDAPVKNPDCRRVWTHRWRNVSRRSWTAIALRCILTAGDVQLLHVDDKGVAHVQMLGACIDCPISLLTMKLGIQRLLKENFTEIRGVNAVTDVDLSALYNRHVGGTRASVRNRAMSRSLWRAGNQCGRGCGATAGRRRVRLAGCARGW